MMPHWSNDVMPFSAHRSSLPTQQVLLQIFCTFARTRVPIKLLYVRGLFLGHKDVPVTMVHAVFFVMMNCHLTAGADTPIIYTHGGLDVICIQTSTFLPPSLIPPSLLSICPPPPPPSSLQPSLNILQYLEGRYTDKSPGKDLLQCVL